MIFDFGLFGCSISNLFLCHFDEVRGEILYERYLNGEDSLKEDFITVF